MPAVESIRAANANSGRAKPCPPKGNNLHQILPFELFLRRIWPHDTPKLASKFTGKSIRQIKYQLAGQSPSFTDAVAFLRSEHGFEFLQHVMGDAQPRWWREVNKARSLGAMRRQLEDQRRRIAQLELAVD